MLHSQVFSIKFTQASGAITLNAGELDQGVSLFEAAPYLFAREFAFFHSETDPRRWKEKQWPKSNIVNVWHLPNDSFIALRTRVAPFDPIKLDALVQRVQGEQHRMIIGQEEPSEIKSGLFDAHIIEALPATATLYELMGVSILQTNMMSTWWTKTGHKPAS